MWFAKVAVIVIWLFEQTDTCRAPRKTFARDVKMFDAVVVRFAAFGIGMWAVRHGDRDLVSVTPNWSSLFEELVQCADREGLPPERNFFFFFISANKG